MRGNLAIRGKYAYTVYTGLEGVQRQNIKPNGPDIDLAITVNRCYNNAISVAVATRYEAVSAGIHHIPVGATWLNVASQRALSQVCCGKSRPKPKHAQPL